MRANIEGSVQTKVYTTEDGSVAIEQSEGAIVLLSADQIPEVIKQLEYLASLRASDGSPLFNVSARDRQAIDAPDPVLSSLDLSTYDELWLFAVDTGNGLHDWAHDLRLVTNREVRLQLLVSGALREFHVGSDAVTIAEVSWRDDWASP